MYLRIILLNVVWAGLVGSLFDRPGLGLLCGVFGSLSVWFLLLRAMVIH